MKIKSIKEIKNIGTFANFKNGGKFRFDKKIIFIFGLNTYGKTTLTDIFQSLKDNNPKIIKNRKTIPTQQGDQKVVLSIKENNEEIDLIFQRDDWGENYLSKYLRIFGTEFIYRNLFTGLSIKRENKENFTDFILGEEGVKFAKSIEKDKKKFREKKKNIKNKLPKFVKDKTENEIDKFMKFDISNLDKEKIESDLLKLKMEKQKEEARLKEPQKILELRNLDKIEIPKFTILENIEKINDYLQKSYEDIKEEFLQRLNKHINKNFKNQDIAENWIKQGFQNIIDKNEICPFCGQSLRNAREIVELYNKYFDENYSRYITEIEETLKRELINIEHNYFNFQSKFMSQLHRVSIFKNLISENSFQNLLKDFEKNINLINDNLIEEEKRKLIGIIKEKIEQKNKKPYIKIEKVNYNNFSKKFKSYIEILNEINRIIEKLQLEIKNFKDKYKNIQEIKENIKKLEEKIEELEYKKARIEQDSDCKNYLKEQEEINKLEENIKNKRKKLEEDQDKFLEKYFKNINRLFEKFGSHNFKIEKIQENVGNKPVYSIKVKFHGREISNEQMEKVFSESDRRALALAIFFSKIELENDNEKEKLIIILDDPITSFDDNRTMNFINYMKENLQKVSQTIIFTHYNKFLSDYNKYTQEKPKTYKIIKNGKLDNFDIDTFLKSEYVQTLEKINNFINGKCKIEPAIFRTFIDTMYKPIFSGIIPDCVIEELYKESCTFNHNNFNYEQEEENIRNFAKRMINKLYSFEYKQ